MLLCRSLPVQPPHPPLPTPNPITLFSSFRGGPHHQLHNEVTFCLQYMQYLCVYVSSTVRPLINWRTFGLVSSFYSFFLPLGAIPDHHLHNEVTSFSFFSTVVSVCLYITHRQAALSDRLADVQSLTCATKFIMFLLASFFVFSIIAFKFDFILDYENGARIITGGGIDTK